MAAAIPGASNFKVSLNSIINVFMFVLINCQLSKTVGSVVPIYPNIYTLVETGLNISDNLILLLPKGIDISNLVILFDVLKH